MALVLIPTAWLAVVFFALTMFHLAALSDDSYDLAMAEGIAMDHAETHCAPAAHIRARRAPTDSPYRIHRAMGRS